MDGPSTLGKFIIVFILVFVLIILFNKTMKGSTKIMQCTANGGQCVDETCEWGKQIPALSSKAAGCEENQICCINITKQKATPDPLCDNRTLGYACRTGYRCDAGKQCVTLCEFCEKNPRTTIIENGRSICNKLTGDADKFANSDTFSCSCTNTECTSRFASGKCMRNYCPAAASDTTNPNYACCVK
jgi:hypothetical protein